MSGLWKVHLGQFRAAGTAWAGVGLTFVAANVALALGALLVRTAVDATASGTLGIVDAAAFIFMGVSNLVFGGLTAIGVISAATGLVVASRRGAIARLALAGATPGQVRRTILVQLAVVTLAAAVVGDLIAVSTVQWFTDGQLAERHLAPGSVAPSRDLGTMLLANLLCVGVALVGGLHHARAASRIPPIEALRATDTGSARRGRVGRWVIVVLGVGTIAAVFALFGRFASGLGPDAGDVSMQLSIALLIWSCGLLGLAAPVTIQWFTRAWTALVPARNATWLLARSAVLARSDRLVRSVLPVVFVIGLLFGLIAVIDTITASMMVSGYDFELSSASFFALFSLIGTALVIAVAGSVGSLVMMSKQRDGELALAGIAGATPRQRLLIPAIEGLIITGTAVALGLVATAVGVGFQYWSIRHLLPRAAVGVSAELFVGIVLACLAVIVAATVLPTIAALRRPTPYVAARLAAE